MESSFNKIPLNQNSNEYIIVETKWLDDVVMINILEYRNSESLPSKEWQGELLHDEIKKTCEALERPYDEFYAECKNALCNPNGLANFIYTIDKDKFTWKKVAGGSKIIYGRVILTKSTENLHLQFLLNSMSLCSQLREKLDSKESEITLLNIRQKEFTKKYNDYVVEKVKHDKELLKKFLLLLNSKKSKIMELKELLYDKNNGDNNYDKNKGNSLLSLQSDLEHDSPKMDVQTLLETDIPTQVNDELLNDSSQSQELLRVRIPKRKQPILAEVEETVKVRNQKDLTVTNNQLDVDSEVYDVDTQKMLEDM